MGTTSKPEAAAYWPSCKLLAISCILLDLVQVFIFLLYVAVSNQLIQGNASLTEPFSVPTLPDVAKMFRDLAGNWSDVVLSAHTCLNSLTLAMLLVSLLKDTTLSWWMFTTRVWMTVKGVYIPLTIVIGLWRALAFYIPASLILYTLGVNVAAFGLMAFFRRQIVQLMEGETRTNRGIKQLINQCGDKELIKHV